MTAVPPSVATPRVVVDAAKLRANIERMQGVCTRAGVELWPHAKTHKSVEVARRQLAAGAAGLTVAKLGEAEALLPSGVRRVFVAYPLVDPETQAARLRALAGSLDELVVAVTSEPQRDALSGVLAAAGLRLPVLMAVDTGLGREGARGLEAARRLADAIRRDGERMWLKGLFTHEGYAYRENVRREEVAREAHAALLAARDALALPGEEPPGLWPGSSVTSAASAGMPGVAGVRPGAYVFGDLWLSRLTGCMAFDEVALTVFATVVDRPEPGLALIDAGSKTFSSDKTPNGLSAVAADGRDLNVVRLSEEHGFVTGADADALRLGERVAFVPAHVCPVVNLADEVTVVEAGGAAETWRVDARGRVR